MRIGITGANGQLGTSLVNAFEGDHDVVALTRPEFDLLNQPGEVIRSSNLDVLIHSAAMTDVDGCTADPALAYKSNGWATGELAAACADSETRMIYISTNEVFSGKEEKVWFEYDAKGPVNAYGRSKLAGEELAMSSGCRLSIARVSWVFGPGFVNFPSKMCELADKLGALKIVADEVACPSYAPDVAEAVGKLIHQDVDGIFHLSNSGPVSRYDFAAKVFELTERNIPTEPIPQSAFSRPSQPPLYTPLGNEMALSLGIEMRPWQNALEEWAEAERALS